MSALLLALLEISDASFLHWMLAAAFTVFVIDVVFAASGDEGTGTILYIIVLVIFSAWGVWRLGLPVQWGVLVFLLFNAVGFFFYFTIWKRVIYNCVVRRVLRNAPEEQIYQMVGKTARVYGEGENICLKWQDEFYPIAAEDRGKVKEGDNVTITAFKGGEAYITRNENREI